MDNEGKLRRIYTCLWFDHQAEEAARFYTGIFHNSSITQITYYDKGNLKRSGLEDRTVMSVKFLLDGEEFLALNGGPEFTFNEAISMVVNCETQEEVDYYWEKLAAGGDEKAQVCGWLKDQYGVSWQIVPVQLQEMISSPDAAVRERVSQAMFKMKKLDIHALRLAYEG